MKKTKNAMVVIGNNSHEITNKCLNENLTKMLNAMASANKSVWQYAYHLSKIIDTEAFADDFSTLAKFGDFIGLSKATISQYTNAIRFIRSQGIIDCVDNATSKISNDFSKIAISVGNAYLLSKIDDYNDFLVWVSDNGLLIGKVWLMSNRQLKALINDYEHRNDITESETETETETETEMETETETEPETETETETETKAEMIKALVDYMIEHDISLNEVGTEIARRNK